MNNDESTEGRALSTQQIADAGADVEDRPSSGQDPAPDSDDRALEIHDPKLDSEDHAPDVQYPALDSEDHTPEAQDPALDSKGHASDVPDQALDNEDHAADVQDPALDAPGQPVPAEQAAAVSYPGTDDHPRAQLLADNELQNMNMHWKDIQSEFVEEPRKAVQDADALVAELMQRLAQMFASERAQLESRWSGGGDVSTEDLRRSLRRYRSFFERLISA